MIPISAADLWRGADRIWAVACLVALAAADADRGIRHDAGHGRQQHDHPDDRSRGQARPRDELLHHGLRGHGAVRQPAGGRLGALGRRAGHADDYWRLLHCRGRMVCDSIAKDPRAYSTDLSRFGDSSGRGNCCDGGWKRRLNAARSPADAESLRCGLLFSASKVRDYLPDFFFGFDFADVALAAVRLTVFAAGFFATAAFFPRRFRLQRCFLRDGSMCSLGRRRGFAVSTCSGLLRRGMTRLAGLAMRLGNNRSLLRFALGRCRFAAGLGCLSQLPCRWSSLYPACLCDRLGHAFAAGFSAFSWRLRA